MHKGMLVTSATLNHEEVTEVVGDAASRVARLIEALGRRWG